MTQIIYGSLKVSICGVSGSHRERTSTETHKDVRVVLNRARASSTGGASAWSVPLVMPLLGNYVAADAFLGKLSYASAP
jgi:hypothetical protein